jgi:hypothetical protein
MKICFVQNCPEARLVEGLSRDGSGLAGTCQLLSSNLTSVSLNRLSLKQPEQHEGARSDSMKIPAKLETLKVAIVSCA